MMLSSDPNRQSKSGLEDDNKQQKRPKSNLDNLVKPQSGKRTDSKLEASPNVDLNPRQGKSQTKSVVNQSHPNAPKQIPIALEAETNMLAQSHQQAPNQLVHQGKLAQNSASNPVNPVNQGNSIR